MIQPMSDLPSPTVSITGPFVVDGNGPTSGPADDKAPQELVGKVKFQDILTDAAPISLSAEQSLEEAQNHLMLAKSGTNDVSGDLRLAAPETGIRLPDAGSLLPVSETKTSQDQPADALAREAMIEREQASRQQFDLGGIGGQAIQSSPTLLAHRSEALRPDKSEPVVEQDLAKKSAVRADLLNRAAESSKLERGLGSVPIDSDLDDGLFRPSQRTAGVPVGPSAELSAQTTRLNPENTDDLAQLPERTRPVEAASKSVSAEPLAAKPIATKSSTAEQAPLSDRELRVSQTVIDRQDAEAPASDKILQSELAKAALSNSRLEAETEDAPVRPREVHPRPQAQPNENLQGLRVPSNSPVDSEVIAAANASLARTAATSRSLTERERESSARSAQPTPAKELTQPSSPATLRDISLEQSAIEGSLPKGRDPVSQSPQPDQVVIGQSERPSAQPKSADEGERVQTRAPLTASPPAESVKAQTTPSSIPLSSTEAPAALAAGASTPTQGLANASLADGRQAQPLSAQIETALDNLSNAIEAGRGARPELNIRNQDFGTINVRLESLGNDVRAQLTARDPGFVPAIQAALADRAVTASSESSASNSQRGNDQQGSQGSYQSGSGAMNSQSEGRYGSSTGSGQASPQPYSEQNEGRDEESPSQSRLQKLEADEGGQGSTGLFA